MMNYKLLLLLAIIAFSAVFAENYVVINSKSGLDVLSGIYYANSIGESAKFMPYNGNVQLTAAKVGSGKDILLIQSANTPVTTFLQGEIEKVNTVTVYATTDDGLKTNLDLAERSGVNKFIIIDPSFGQNAISVLSYAKRTGSYVIFAYSGNIDDVVSFLDGKANPQITVFGYVDSATKEKLAKYTPSTIGKGEDKYEDNVAIVSKEIAEYDVTQAIMADGTYIEEGMVDGVFPVVLVSPIVSDYTYNFVLENARSKTLNYYTLVGSNLVNPTYDLKKKVQAQLLSEGKNLTIGVVVKFGQSVPGNQGVYPLDMFPVPFYSIGLSIDSLKYNKASGKVELTITSTAEGPEYYQSEIHVKQDGADLKVLGDSGPSVLERGETRGLQYDYTLPSLEQGNITADVVVRFGETAKSLTSFTAKTANLVTYTFTDTSNLDVTGASYNTGNLRINIKNVGDQDALVQTAVDLVVGGSKTTVKSDAIEKVTTGSITVVTIPIELSAADIEANKDVTVKLTYGARSGFMEKTKEATVPLQVPKVEGPKGIDPLMIALIILLVILIIVVVYFATRKSKDEKKRKKDKAKDEEEE
jgi:hypothetical protein